MILTDKAKVDFQKWYYQTYCNSKIKMGFSDFPLICQHALIIDWFDSVGIYIQDWGLEIVENEIGFDSQVFYKKQLHETQENFAKTRKEAIQKAIIKANTIYNENRI
jgi:hypothetical protein